MAALLTMARNKKNNLVSVYDVPNGLKCECFCPHCGASLIARNGGDENKRDYHFAHAKGVVCENAFETALHLLAKEIIKEKRQICLPSSYGADLPSGIVKLHDVVTEKKDKDFGFIPDAEGIMENGERLLIEFFVSHKVDNNKRKKILDNKIKCIELDINSLDLNRTVMENFICNEEDGRKWIATIPDVAYKHDGISSGHPANNNYQQVRDRLKYLFETQTLKIQPTHKNCDNIEHSEPFNLRYYGYDTCIIGKKYRGLKTDLLLLRSSKKEIEKRGYIAICIRGRRRNYGFKYPKGLRVIDIIISRTTVNIEGLFKDGFLNDPYLSTVEYVNFKI